MGKIKALVFILLSFVMLFPSCGENDFKIENIDFTYLKDELGSFSFLAYFQYPKTEQFEASMSIKTADGKFAWKSHCQDFSVGGKNYKVAGRFSLPQKLSNVEIKVEVNYRDKTLVFDKKLDYPTDTNVIENIEIFNFGIKPNSSRSSNYNIDYASSFAGSDEYAYSYKTNNFISSSNVITSKLQTIKTTNDTTHIHLIEKKPNSRIVYTRTIDVNSLKSEIPSV